MRLLGLSLLLASLLASSCIVRDHASTQKPTKGSTTTPTSPGQSRSHWVLLRTDLGLGDGYMVRLADAELAAQAKQGRITYTPVGDLPKPLEHEAGADDVGLPVPHSQNPGEMTLTEAEALLAQVPECDVLVISSGYLARAALEAINRSQQAKSLLILDEQGIPQELPAATAPVVRLHYNVEPLAYLAGIAAAQSSTIAHFGILHAADDPQGQEFAAAAKRGAKYHSNGAWTEIQPVPVGPQGYVTADDFRKAYAALKAQGGPNWKPNHFILDLGRSTPTIMNALSKKPDNGFLVAAYGDYRPVRPARVVGCVLKQPDKALAALFKQLDLDSLGKDASVALKAVAPDSVFTTGLDEGAVAFTDFGLYSQYNTDGQDLAETVQRKLAQIKAGELDISR
jgi:hypothetical protein